ncbi:unnamed protein product, partial [Ilex paraguariensis]
PPPPIETTRDRVEKEEEDERQRVEDIYNAYDQLCEEFLKQKKRVLSLSSSLNTNEEKKKALHVELVKSKAHICMLEENKSLKNNLDFSERVS